MRRKSSKIKDLTGRRFGRLVALASSRQAPKRQMWMCQCDCGREHEVGADHLIAGRIKSCGCGRALANKKRITHGLSKSREYGIWSNMKNRCYNPKVESYADYGARGITVCDPWLEDFGAFVRDMGRRPSPKHELDRINNNGPYSPENCRWVLRRQNANNKRSNILLTVDGVTKAIGEWASLMGVSYNMILRRVMSKWPDRDAVLIPSLKTLKGQRSSPVRKRGDYRHPVPSSPFYW